MVEHQLHLHLLDQPAAVALKWRRRHDRLKAEGRGGAAGKAAGSDAVVVKLGRQHGQCEVTVVMAVVAAVVVASTADGVTAIVRRGRTRRRGAPVMLGAIGA